MTRYNIPVQFDNHSVLDTLMVHPKSTKTAKFLLSLFIVSYFRTMDGS